MGAGGSTGNETAEFKAVRYRWAPLLTLLRLTEGETRVLYDIFARIDKDKSGTLSYDELIDFVDTKSSPFLRRVMSVFDSDTDGTMDFGEFVTAVWNFNTYDLTGLTAFAFELYDKDQSGKLGADELRGVVDDIFANEKGLGRIDGADLVAGAMLKLAKEMNAAGTDEITRDRFEIFVLERPEAIQPVLDL